MSETTKGITGLRKAAILLMMVGTKKAAEAISRCRLQQSEIERLVYEMARVGAVDEQTQHAVAQEFSQRAASAPEAGGLRYAEAVLSEVLGTDAATGFVQGVRERRSARPFAAIADLGAKQLLEALRDEQPHAIAVVLRYLPRRRAAEVLSGLSDDVRIEVVMRLVKAGDPSHETLQHMEVALSERAASLASWESAEDVVTTAGPRALVELLNQADLSVENAVLESLAARDPELGEQVRESMFIYEDLPRLDPRALQTVLRQLEVSDLALALKGSSEQVKSAVFDNLSENAAAGLREELESLGPVRRRDVNAAQQKIVMTVRTQMQEGHISLRQEEPAEEMIS